LPAAAQLEGEAHASYGINTLITIQSKPMVLWDWVMSGIPRMSLVGTKKSLQVDAFYLISRHCDA
jgi:hypothetical protein